MKRFAEGLSILALLAAFTACAGHSTVETAKWRYFAPIQSRGPLQSGLVEIDLPLAVFDLAQDDLSDLRILKGGQSGLEMPYVLSVTKGKVRRERIPARPYHWLSLPGQDSAVTVDFGKKVLKDGIEIVTSGLNFKREVQIEGSDNGTGWDVIRVGAFLLRNRDFRYDRRLVRLQKNDNRYLRITVFQDPEAPQMIEIEGVSALRELSEPPSTEPVPVVEALVTEKPPETEIVLDLQYRNIPLHEMRLNFKESNFFRTIRIAGTNTVEETGNAAQANPAQSQKASPGPWNHIISTAIFRYTSGGAIDEAVDINLKSARCRFLRILVENIGEPPLTFESASVKRLATRLSFLARDEGTYSFFLGNPEAARPEHDLTDSAVAGLRAAGVQKAVLDWVTPNPGYGQSLSWYSPRRLLKFFLGALLLILVAGLGFAVYRWSAPRPAETSQGPDDAGRNTQGVSVSKVEMDTSQGETES